MTTKIFQGYDDFEAWNAACAYLRTRGFSVGPLQTGSPVGVLLGESRIAKWKSLDPEERSDLHGILTTADNNFRAGPVTLAIRDDAPASVFEALTEEPEAPHPTSDPVGIDLSDRDPKDIHARPVVEGRFRP